MLRNVFTEMVVSTVIATAVAGAVVGCGSERGQGEEGAKEAASPKAHDRREYGERSSARRLQAEHSEVESLKEIEGVVYLSGNEPFVNLALESLDGKIYYLQSEREPELRNLQNRMVRVTGYLHPSPMTGVERDTLQVVNFEVVHSEGD